jgi:hypothetical protein
MEVQLQPLEFQQQMLGMTLHANFIRSVYFLKTVSIFTLYVGGWKDIF